MASKRQIRKRSCETKKAYKTPAEARRVIWLITHDPGARGKVTGVLNAYHCKFCGLYHIGHENRARREARLAARHEN